MDICGRRDEGGEGGGDGGDLCHESVSSSARSDAATGKTGIRCLCRLSSFKSSSPCCFLDGTFEFRGAGGGWVADKTGLFGGKFESRGGNMTRFLLEVGDSKLSSFFEKSKAAVFLCGK